jgi:polysaccharide export outer membrane protein
VSEFAKLCFVIACCGWAAGCAHGPLQDDLFLDLPRELQPISHPTYRVAAPDILVVEAVSNLRSPNVPLRVGDVLFIKASNTLPFAIDATSDRPEIPAELEIEQAFKIINGPYQIGPDGRVDLGPEYGQVGVAGLSVEAAEQQVRLQLQKIGLTEKTIVDVTLPDASVSQPVTGEHLVRSDGTISLGIYGTVYVAGLSLQEITAAVEQRLGDFMSDPQVYVDVLAYNSQAYYVITDGGGFGEQVVRLPITGNETVLDAVSQIQGLSQVSSRNIWIARPAPAGAGVAQILPINWREIAAEGVTTTNYQLLPGDRVYIQADRLIALDNIVAKITAPVERVFGVLLLGDSVFEQLRVGGLQNQGGF